MRYLFAPALALALLSGLYACGEKAAQSTAPVDTVKVERGVDPKVFEGEYIGNFGGGHIVLVISYVQGKNVSGYNIHKGLKRNIKGTLSATGGTYRFQLAEPGDHAYDGTFDFTLNPGDFTGHATWTPNDKSKLKTKNFDLRRREHDYDAETAFTGFWDGSGMMEIKDGGIAELTYWVPVKGKEDEEGEQQTLRGQWLAEGKTLTVEWPKNTYTGSDKFVLTLSDANEDGYKTLADKNKKWEFYQY